MLCSTLWPSKPFSDLSRIFSSSIVFYSSFLSSNYSSLLATPSLRDIFIISSSLFRTRSLSWISFVISSKLSKSSLLEITSVFFLILFSRALKICYYELKYLLKQHRDVHGREYMIWVNLKAFVLKPYACATLLLSEILKAIECLIQGLIV